MKDFEIFSGLTVLCVEDEYWVRESFVEFLKRRFKEVYSAEDGADGLEQFRKHKPDIVVTDIMMPKMNGLEMSQKIKEESPETPIIIISAFNDTYFLLEAINIGIDSYVNKPVNNKKLIEALEKNARSINFKKSQKEVEEKDLFIEIIANNSPVGIVLFGESIKYCNKAFGDITGYAGEENTSFPSIFLEEDAKRIEFELDKTPENFKISEARLFDRDNRIKFLDISFNKIMIEDKPLYVANLVNITRRKLFEVELEQNRLILEDLNSELKHHISLVEEKNKELEIQLYTDKLTSLPNRLSLIEAIKKTQKPFLVLLNIDSFKEINDFYGSEIGDKVINDIALKLQELAKGTGFTLYKMQADEYALLNAGTFENFDEFIVTLHDKLEDHKIYLKDQEVHIRITAGAAHESEESVLAKADMSLKRAKKTRRSYLIYDDSMTVMKEYEENFKWLNMLKSALEEGRLVSYYQPIYNNRTGEINKYECLARLISAEGNVYSPYFFIDISKKSRLYQKITRKIVTDAFETFKSNTATFSLNLSIDDILDKNTIDFIFEGMKRYDIGSRVIFEILESEGIENYENVAEFINAAKELGAKVAIDDFGSGYSNFSHILKLNIDFLKIDASIIKNSDTDKNSQIISQTIVDFSKKLNIKTVAEFVHSHDVFEIVKNFGVDFSQGYYIAEPKKELVTVPYFKSI